MTDKAALNTDRELFREDTGEMAGNYYENSVHATADGRIGMSVGGRMVVLPIAEWHELAWPNEHEDSRCRAVLFNDITHAPLGHDEYFRFSDRRAIADYLWDQGWRREVRDEDVTER